MSPYNKLRITIEEMISVIQVESINLKNAGDTHRAYVLKEAANFLIIQKRNRVQND